MLRILFNSWPVVGVQLCWLRNLGVYVLLHVFLWDNISTVNKLHVRTHVGTPSGWFDHHSKMELFEPIMEWSHRKCSANVSCISQDLRLKVQIEYVWYLRHDVNYRFKFLLPSLKAFDFYMASAAYCPTECTDLPGPQLKWSVFTMFEARKCHGWFVPFLLSIINHSLNVLHNILWLSGTNAIRYIGLCSPNCILSSLYQITACVQIVSISLNSMFRWMQKSVGSVLERNNLLQTLLSFTYHPGQRYMLPPLCDAFNPGEFYFTIMFELEGQYSVFPPFLLSWKAMVCYRNQTDRSYIRVLIMKSFK